MDEDIARVRAIDSPVARCVAALLDVFMHCCIGSQVVPFWCAAARSLHYRLVAGASADSWVDCWFGIETQGVHTVGLTVVDRHGLTGNPANAHVLLGLDRVGFIVLLVQRLQVFN